MQTSLTVGKSKRVYFDESYTQRYITMHDNPKFEKTYNNIDEFLKEFYPTKPSKMLLVRIKEEFEKAKGRITYKPVGYKANQNFYFENKKA